VSERVTVSPVYVVPMTRRECLLVVRAVRLLVQLEGEQRAASNVLEMLRAPVATDGVFAKGKDEAA
jgi:hypothetical protein